ncbi:hypothetical protein GPECTOR_28g850 [Gonium pectorale]|uniref:RelA/SpoT domain-containing protein n=1 Tax=Gonium pectorale TaxID=33097 RepID=A0A150GGG9_GONPE|nr:hypothetical protein GPECTOR_28g850 [Gonium pectorale]|eukprot:KXZ48440.1 hypothetical protein GPECTOR_28g850 [Gonium pectorale]
MPGSSGPSLGTLESVDGPLLLDDIVLPSFTDGSAAAAATRPSPPPAAAGNGSAAPGPFILPTRPVAAAAAAAAIKQALQPASPSSSHSHSPSFDASAASSAASPVSPLSDTPPPESVPLAPLTPAQERLRLILSTVVPFECVSFKSLRGLAGSTRRGLEVLDECAALLYNEIQIRSQAGGLGINIQGRLKSLHSVYRKMVRKGVAVAQVYDSRALRVIVDDADGSQLAEAVESCYRLVGAVHSLWKPIKREFDDYIANPKPSGYQALHTAVRGPGGIPMEVQIKTSSMHELAEYGAAAHWVYKEYTPLLAQPGRGRGGGRGGGPPAAPPPPGFVGQPVLKVAKDKLRWAGGGRGGG